MKKSDIEKSLKRFLKRKIGYSLSLLIAFLITGEISLSAGITAEEIQEAKSDLLIKIQTEREEIKRKIAENEKLIKEYNSNFVELLRKGNFYSKPTFKSTQLFFTYQYLDNGKMKNRTNKEFSETINAVNKYYKTSKSKGTAKVLEGNGFAVDDTVFRETIEVGANIKLIQPDLPTVTPNISVTASAPKVNLGALPKTINPAVASVSTVTAPVIAAPTPPGGVSITVSTPSAVEKITVTAPVITAPMAPTEKNVKISNPTLPEGYDPTIIKLPAAPSLPVVVPVNVSSPSIAGSGANPSVQYFWWDGNDGVISQISLKSGKYVINGNSGAFNVDVTNYDAEAFPGTAPQGSKPVNGTYTVNRKFFHTLLNVPYSYYGENAEIIFNSNNAKLIDLETEGVVNGNLDNRVTEGLITSATRDRLRGYQAYTGIKGNDNTELLFVNKGKVEINGTNSAYFFTTSHTNGGLRTNYLDNEGTIIVNGDKSAVYMHSPDTSESKAYIYSNGPTGKIYVDGVGASLMQWVYANLSHNRAAFVNEGTAEIRGAEAIALYMSNNSTFHNGHAAYIKKPIELLGDKSVGLVAQNTNITNEKNIVKFNIGKKKQTIAKGNSVNNIFTGRTNDPNLVEQAIGILMDNSSTTKTAAQIEIGEYSYGGIGIFGKNGTIEILKPYGAPAENSSIKISGGEGNIGIIAQGGDVKFEGDISIENGKNNQIAIAQNGKTITINGNVTAGDSTKKIEDTVALYAKDSGTVINIAKDKLNLNLSGNSTGIFATSQGSIIADRTSLTLSQPNTNGNIPEPTTPVNIYVEGKIQADGSTSGLGIYASDGGKISVKNTYVKVKDGTVGAVATGANSNIDLSGGIVDYSGDGYAVYTSNGGTVNLSNGEIILRGKATALELDLSTPSSNPITLTGAKIVVMSNDAVGVNLKNIGTLNIGTLKTDIENKLGGVNIVAGTDGTQVFDKYKIAAVDGGILNINTDMNKSDTSTTSPGFFYYRRFLGQRLNLNVLNGIKVKSEINSSDAAAYFKGQVVGLEMSSSKAAASASDAQINLAAGSKVIADRTDAGAGAIGLYMNFGKIDIAATAGVEVEKGANTVNDKAVGVYAVNGSKVDNAGDIKVNGNQSIGILGMTYREQPAGTPVVNEFGTGGIFTDQGKINITNSGYVALGGTGTIGIYAYNNNAAGTRADAKVTNTVTGIVDVGNSTAANAAIGIYGEKTTISNLGIISVGSNGIAIYAKNNSEITDLGSLNLGADGIGVMLDSTSDLTAANVSVTSNGTGTSGKTVIFYKGTGAGHKAINVAIDASALNKGTAVYAENMSITSQGALSIGTSGIGIFVKGTGTNLGYNEGSITLGAGKTGAVGMYTKTAHIVNNAAGVINVNDSSQIGMYAEGSSQALNRGTINLNVDRSTGIYLKGAYTELDSTGNIVFGGKSSIGVFGEGARVEFGDNMTLSNANENKNIFVYGKDSRVEITAGKTVTIDGMAAAATPGNKTVGIYLENAGTGSRFVSNTTGKLNVVNEAVGLYSKGNNNLDVNVTATGDKTTGVFIDGASEITGTVTARGNAVGVYGSGGAVTIGAAGLTLNTDTARGTGMYLTDGASAAGGTITVNNTAAGTKNIGVYYSKGTASGAVTNSSDISLAGSESIGIYAADGINLVNNSNITSTAGKSENIGSYVGGGSQLTSAGTITMNDSDSIGMYTEEGKGINSGNILMNGASSAPNKSVVGMVAEAQAGKTAAVENSGTISAGANLGMYIGGLGTSSGKNTGTITTTTGTGVYVDGTANTFAGTGGTINSNKVGIYLKNTGANKITTGTLNIASGGVGVFGENANIDFTVDTSNSAEAVGVAAKGTSVISGNITTGQDSVGVYVLDNNVSFNGANITTGPSVAPGKSSIGILLNKALGAYTMSNVTVNAQNGVGIYLDGTAPGTHLTHNGTVNTVGGIGIYVDDGTTLTTGTTVLNINGGTGVYMKGGTANLGTGGNLTFNFLAGGGIGVFNNGGTMNLGANITVTGSGSLAATTNGSLSSSGNLSIGEGATGLMGLYDAGLTAAHSVNSSGTITAVSGGIGLAAVKGTTNPAFPVTVNNTGTINASGVSTTNTPSIGIYTNAADTVNTGNINVGNKGIGIYSAHSGILTSVQNNNMTMTGTDGIGVYIKGTTNGLTANNITSIGSRNTGVVLEGTAGNINVGTIALGNESVGTFVTGAAASTIDGTITVGNGSTSKSAIGVVAQNGANMTLAGTAAITTGTKGIGVYAEGAGTIVTVSNTGNISVGAEGIYMYSKDAVLNFSGNITADNQIGIVADGGTINAVGASAITVQNGGIGAYVKNAAPAFGATAINVQGGTSSKYSMGVYYDGVAALGAAPVITQTGSYTIGMVLNNSTGTTAGGISLGSAADNNQVGVMAKGNSNLTIAGNISVGGDKNIGVYGESSQITANGNLSVGNSSASGNKSTSSIGVSLNGGTYTGAGDISVGDYSIGIFGKGMGVGSVITQGTGAQTMIVGKDGLGIYGAGTGGAISANMSNITVGTDNAIGVYAKGMNSIVTGNMNIGANTSVGIVSEGNGNVTYTGAMTIANKADKASVGIYKADGTGKISTSAGNWSVGNSGYGIYLKQTAGQSAVIENRANIVLGMSSVGMYSEGTNTIINTGNITVGSTNVNGDHNNLTKHENSVGMYLSGGTAATSSGTITVNHDHSVGVYGQGGGTRFTNTGTMNIDNGGIGVLIRDGAVAINEAGGNINLGGTLASSRGKTVGMAAYTGATIENRGTITVNEGIGMLVGNQANLINRGTIYVNNGTGIEGAGNITNTGNIVVTGAGKKEETNRLTAARVGAVIIQPDGTIKINDKYTAIGGTLSTAGNIIVNGAYVDVTTKTPLFNAHSVSGDVRILPNFALTGNGISYEIKGFVNTATKTITGTKLTPVTSPLFIAKVTNKGDLVIAKRPYADLTIGKQFDAMDKGLDNVLKNSGGKGRDADILKGLNHYLEGMAKNKFTVEASKKLAEFRGDIYATIQGRMQDINRAFDNSFYELESSYNLTKDSSKYSVIYTDGNYKNSTLGIDDYDYKVMGLLYMKEKEGTEYGSKYGYTLGFAGSKFDFDDGGSKEDVYSLRVGAHRVKNLSDEHKVSWLSRIELGYNRHITKRKLELDKTYENKGEYNTYSVAFDNRLTKVIYTDLSRQLAVYADLDLEYGKVDDFKESAGSKGGLEVQIKDNDYFSAQAGAGVKASQRIYAGNDISVKVAADVKYAYEFGDNYDGNKARLKNGGEGYYSLITPEEREGKLIGKVGMTVEKANYMGVTFEVEAADEGNRKDSSIKYGVRFNYKF
ncbi:autotransporter-associated N-terminal domain-containing protein [Fusobacterium varium]|uniref:autotransporter-associated N-terminal domain-containing protein n=1 Tax=Fusobacterium TaxID=848 RepID=UPI0030D1C900